MGDYVRIFRTYRKFGRYFLLAYNSEDYQYAWQSPRYRWLWQARTFGVKAARRHLHRKYPEYFAWAGKFAREIGIERIDL